MSRPRNETLTDIDDGAVEKSVHKKHSQQKVLTFTLNIDGGVITEKTAKRLWPVQFSSANEAFFAGKHYNRWLVL